MSVKLSLLGGFKLLVADEPVVVKAQKSKAVLARLACQPGSLHSRDRLAELLWPDHSDANAKASLRQSLASLRRLLPADILTNHGEDLRLEPELVRCDVADIRALKHASDAQSLASAADLYQGHFLQGFQTKADGFMEWLTVERESLRREALAIFNRWFDSALAANDADSAIRAGVALLGIDPLQEAVHRQLMQLYVQQDQLGSAMRQFRLCRDALQRELSAPPSVETIELYRSLGLRSDAGRTTPEPAAITSPATDRRAALPTIGVLPFASMSPDPDHEYVADGMTEELINLLTTSANWRVASRNLCFRYKGGNADVREIGRELNVAYIVEGGVRRIGERMRVSAQLINAADGTQIWSDRYDRGVAEIFDVQDEVVHSIFRVLKNRLGFAERERVRRTPTTNLDAWGLLIRAMQIQPQSRSGHREQLQLINEALAIDPDYARAQAYIASVLFTLVGRGISKDPAKNMKEATAYAEQALASEANDVLVLRFCAGGFAAVGQAERAQNLAERAFELTGSPDPLFVAVLMWVGRLEEAQGYCEQIVAALPAGLPSAPTELRPVALLGNLHMLQDELDAALEYARQDLLANPGLFFSHVNLANVLGQLGRHQEARAAWAQAQALVPELTVEGFAFGYRAICVDPQHADKFTAGLLLAGIR